MYRAVIVTTPVIVYYESGTTRVETEVTLDAGDVLLFPSADNMRRIVAAHLGPTKNDGMSVITNGTL